MHDNYKQLIEKLLPDAHEREAFFACYHDILPKSIKIIEHTIPAEEFINYTSSLGRTLSSPEFVANNDSRYIDRADTTVAL